MSVSVVGRDTELAALKDFVAEVPDGASALVLEGEAGMGKTTLWSASLELAEEAGYLVLRARPAESETALSFSGVRDLLDPVLERALACLPDAQRRALSRALVLEEDEGPAPDPHAVGVAVLGAVREVSVGEPLVLAVDDVQWLDAASSFALSFAARRLEREAVGVLLARRTPLDSPIVAELRRSLAERCVALDVGPLDVASLHRVVRDRLEVVVPRPLLSEVHHASGGNPFFALEIIRTLQRSGISVEAGSPLPVPESLHELVHGRVGALPPESREFLLAAAAHAHPTIAVTEAASGVDRAAGLPPALAAGVVELDGDRIRFTHPLLAAGVYEGANSLRKADVHARLAELLEDPEARAWQLAASVAEPDESVAAVIEDAGRHARARGAPRPAALLLDRARQLTPADRSDDAVRRAVDAAYLHFESGDSRRAEAQLAAVLADLGPGAMRATALVRLARVRSYENQREAAALFEEALGDAGDDPRLLAVAHEGLAACLFRLREQLESAVEHAALAASYAGDLGDDVLAAEALGTQTLAEAVLGRASAAETAASALALDSVASAHRTIGQPLFAVAVYRWWSNEVESALEAGHTLVERGRELGDEGSLPYLLVVIGQGEFLLGDLEAAHEHAVTGRELAQQSGQRTIASYCRALEALVAATRGDAARARALAADALAGATETGGRPAELVARSALGQLELASGAADASLAALEPIVRHVRSERFGEPSAMWFVVDAVEALVVLGRTDEACELLDWYEGHARRLARVAAIANVLRCRSLITAHAGEVERAHALCVAALDEHDKLPFPLDRGRTLLALGAMQRRMKRRREARATLEEALALFEGIGAALWAEHARAELKRISGRAATPGALTPAEERVARLVAEGKTNKEVAAALFVSERTVEGHISRIFGKLGIRHRTEIASVLTRTQTQGSPSSNTGGSPVSTESSAP